MGVLNEQFLDTTSLSLFLAYGGRIKFSSNSALFIREATVGYYVRREISEKVQGNVANVGRNDPSNQRDVNDWNRDNGNGNVFAVSVVVSKEV